MALKPCRECGKEVSTEAPNCPACGIANPGGLSKPVVIEATAKKYKAAQAGGCAMMALSMLLIAGSASAGTTGDTGTSAFLLLGGLVLFLWGRLAAWWHHR